MSAGDVQVTITGNATADPELRFVGSGAATATFTVAATPRVFDRQSGEYRDGDALFMRVNVWREQAEQVAESVKRGMRLVVTGRLRQRSFEHQGQKRTVIELEADEVAVSLRYATAQVSRVGRSDRGAPSGGGGQATDPWTTGAAADDSNEAPF